MRWKGRGSTMSGEGKLPRKHTGFRLYLFGQNDIPCLPPAAELARNFSQAGLAASPNKMRVLLVRKERGDVEWSIVRYTTTEIRSWGICIKVVIKTAL